METRSRARKRGAPGASSVSAPLDASPAKKSKTKHISDATDELPTLKVLKRYSGTINLYKRWGARPPMNGKPAEIIKTEFVSCVVESQDDLEKIANKVRSYEFSGSMGGKGSLVQYKHPLKEASRTQSIDFSRNALAFAVFARRAREPKITEVRAAASGSMVQVRCSHEQWDMSSIDSKSGQQWVGFAAAVVPRPPGVRQSWTGAIFSGNAPGDLKL